MGGALAIGGFAHAALTSPSGFFIDENTTTAGDVTSDLGAPVYSIVGGADQAKFSINAATGRLSFIAAPNFEAPTDANSDNAYIVEVSDGPTFESITVRVQNVNEAPVISSGTTATQAENTTVTGYTAAATDADAGDTLTYSFGGGADDALFTINANTGVLSFVAAPNFENPLDVGADNGYVVDIEVTDGNLTDTETVTVTVTNANEAPVYTGLTTATQNENTTVTGYTAAATDVDAGTALTYVIGGGTDDALFTINANTGVLSFIAAPNFENALDADANNSYVVGIEVSDGSMTDTELVTVTVQDVNEAAPVFTSGTTATLVENTTATGYTVSATDADASATLQYSISGGADQARFSLVNQVLSFVAAPNFEAPNDANTDNVYVVNIDVTDGVNTISRTVSVTVTDGPEVPVFTSGTTATQNENTTVTGYTATATDEDSQNLTYAISGGGTDDALFAINANTGVLSFIAAPNFEAPSDANTDNSYLVDISVSDGVNVSFLNLTVTVVNVNEAPVFTSGTTATLVENTTATGYTATATDADAGATLTFRINGGADNARFALANGVLSFLAAPNFEAPNDVDTDNVYVVNIEVTDGTLITTQTVTVAVTDEAAPTGLQITAMPGGFKISVTAPSTANIQNYSFEYRVTGTQDWYSVVTSTPRTTIGALDGLAAYEIQVAAVAGEDLGQYVSGSETTLSYVAGPAGQNGTNGTNGTNGADGATGPAGPQGASGTNGTNGADGATGPAGPQGASGTNGATGATGPAGPQGATGATGPAGPQGATGAKGADGVLIGFNGNVTTLSKAQARSLASMVKGATSVNVNVYKKANESFSTMQKRFVSVKKAINAANPGVKVTAKYRSTKTVAACASKSNRCAVVSFKR